MASESQEVIFNGKTKQYFNSFYRVLFRSVVPSDSPYTLRDFPTAVKIPNDLKNLTSERGLRLIKFTEAGTYKLRDLLPNWEINGCQIIEATKHLELHVTTRECTFQMNNDTWTVPKSTSLILVPEESASVKDLLISVVSVPAALGLEFIYHSTMKTLEDIPVEAIPSQILVTKAHINENISFLRQQLSMEEIKERIIFIDAKLASDHLTNLHPLRVIVLNYVGEVIVDEKVTPRIRILAYDTEVHHIHKDDAIGHIDEIEFLRELRAVWVNKILIGYNLRAIISGLGIRIAEVMGVRDLAYAKCVPPHFPSKIGQFRRLEYLSCNILGRNVEKGVNLETELIKAIREIYLRIEYSWEDDLMINFLASEPTPPMNFGVLGPSNTQLSIAPVSLSNLYKTAMVDPEELESPLPKMYRMPVLININQHSEPQEFTNPMYWVDPRVAGDEWQNAIWASANMTKTSKRYQYGLSDSGTKHSINNGMFNVEELQVNRASEGRWNILDIYKDRLADSTMGMDDSLWSTGDSASVKVTREVEI